MKLTKYLAAALVAATAVSGAFADDFDFGGDDFGFGGDSSGSGSSSPIEFSGTLSVNARDYVDNDNTDGIGNTSITSVPQAKLGVKYDSSKVGADLQLKINEDTIKNHPVDVIDELTLSGYFGNLTVTAGKMKVVWGKGDKVHVIDNFNADDYTDFIIPDYLDRRISTPMARLVYAVPYSNSVLSNLTFEGVYTPFTPTNRYASKGIWKPSKVTQLETTLRTTALSTYGSMASGSGVTDQAKAGMLSLLNSVSDNIYPDTNKFEYGQGGARVTATLGQVDLGVSYYYGHYKDVSVDKIKLAATNAAGLNNYMYTYLSGGSPAKFLAYDKKQTFGLEMSTILWKFNLRGEACYNLTDDIAGDDPAVHNNSIGWLGGFDIDLPFWDANLNVQEYGTYVLKNNKIDDLGAYKTYDVDYDSNGYSNNKLVVNFTTSFLNGKIAPEVTAVYGIEHKDLVVLPKVTFKPASAFKIITSGMYMWTNDEADSEFGTWHKNSFVQLAAEVAF